MANTKTSTAKTRRLSRFRSKRLVICLPLVPISRCPSAQTDDGGSGWAHVERCLRIRSESVVGSPTQITERPTGFRSEARHNSKSQAGECDRGESEDAYIRNDREVKDDQRAGKSNEQWVRLAQSQAAPHQTAQRERDARDAEQRGREGDHQHHRHDREEEQREP